MEIMQTNRKDTLNICSGNEGFSDLISVFLKHYVVVIHGILLKAHIYGHYGTIVSFYSV